MGEKVWVRFAEVFLYGMEYVGVRLTSGWSTESVMCSRHGVWLLRPLPTSKCNSIMICGKFG